MWGLWAFTVGLFKASTDDDECVFLERKHILNKIMVQVSVFGRFEDNKKPQENKWVYCFFPQLARLERSRARSFFPFGRVYSLKKCL